MRYLALLVSIFLLVSTPAFAAKRHHSKPKPPAVALGITGTAAQYSVLKHQGMPLSIRATWESWAQGRTPEEIFSEDQEIGATPLVNWEPDNTAKPGDPNYSLQAIVEGRLDTYEPGHRRSRNTRSLSICALLTR